MVSPQHSVVNSHGLSDRFIDDYRGWFIGEIKNLTDEIPSVSPSEWAETNRYLSQGVTAIPGYYSYAVAPYLREIVNCFDVRSPVREINFKKGSQIGATTGVLENTIGYIMRHVPSAPAMMFTTDDSMAKRRISKNIIPMINQSGLAGLIQSSDVTNHRKTGKTRDLIEWKGGGSLVPAGAKSAAAMRSDSIQYLLLDEVDGYPLEVGGEGCPMKLAEGRTKGFWQSRKIGRMSTPKVKGTSKIDPEFDKGDKRYYFVPCKDCGHEQILKFMGKNKKGERFGLVWEMENGKLVPGTVRYKCEQCGFLHRNADKTYLLPRGKWVPTGVPVSPEIRSYHLSSLYAPAGMYTWEAVVIHWLECWDVDNNRSKDNAKLQVFYNTELGESFAVRANRVTFSAISGHRRAEYRYGDIPNKHAVEHAESKILLLTAAVDVHDKHLDCSIIGWAKGKRPYVIDYYKFNGDATDKDDPQTWGKIADLIENKTYETKEGLKYRIALTLVDSSYNDDLVCSFCSDYESGVYPIKGRPDQVNSKKAIKEFTQFETQAGTLGFMINVDLYKDRWNSALRKQWSGQGVMPQGHFSAPLNMTDKELRELTVEYRTEKIDRTTGQKLGHVWNRPSGARNELWDLLVYNSAALDMIAWGVTENDLKSKSVNWNQFFDYIETNQSYFEA